MSITRRIAFGAGASWFSRGVLIVLGVLLMPVLFRKLGKEELGVWLLLGQTWSLMGILDLGLGSTLTRRIALAKGKSGGDPDTPLTDETRSDIADLVASGRRLYQWLALGVFLLSFAAGCFYLRGLELTTLSLGTAWLAWGILCLAQALGVWATFWTCLLQGIGYVGWDLILSSIVGTLTLIFQIVAVSLGGGLVSLAAIMATGSVVQRLLLLNFARRRRPELFQIQGSWNPVVVRSMIGPALRAWLTGIGLTLAMHTDQFFIVNLKGASELPPYRAAYLLFMNLALLAVSVSGASAVFVSHLWQAGQIREVHRLVVRNLRFGLAIIVCGGACIVMLGTRLFDLWLGPGNFVGFPILIVFLVTLSFEVQAMIISTSSRATEDEAFMFCALAGGALKIVLAILLGRAYGLLGIAVATMLAQLGTNHWFMVHRGFRRLQMSISSHLREVVVPVGLAFVATIVLVWLVQQPLSKAKNWVAVGAGAAVTGLILAIALWRIVLQQSERVRILTYIGKKVRGQQLS